MSQYGSPRRLLQCLVLSYFHLYLHPNKGRYYDKYTSSRKGDTRTQVLLTVHKVAHVLTLYGRAVTI
jgi:hypothetical protein